VNNRTQGVLFPDEASVVLKEMIEKLCQDLGMPAAKMEQKNFSLPINPETAVSIRELPPGFAIFSKISPCPGQKREDLLIFLMRANFLGQGTGGARIGLEADEKLLTLSHGFPYEMNYQGFKESVEDFVNYVVYWRDELNNWDKQS
jgi:hypothetical protein